MRRSFSTSSLKYATENIAKFRNTRLRNFEEFWSAVAWSTQYLIQKHSSLKTKALLLWLNERENVQRRCRDEWSCVQTSLTSQCSIVSQYFDFVVLSWGALCGIIIAFWKVSWPLSNPPFLHLFSLISEVLGTKPCTSLAIYSRIYLEFEWANK